MSKKPHIHADVIKAWADGAQIERYAGRLKGLEIWNTCPFPTWKEFDQYRIKPEPKPDVVTYGQAVLMLGNGHVPTIVKLTDGGTVKWRTDNVKFVFDGESEKLKSVELIK
jgi:hypothetical protein